MHPFNYEQIMNFEVYNYRVPLNAAARCCDDFLQAILIYSINKRSSISMELHIDLG